MNRVSGLFQASFSGLLGGILSERMKRLVFLASFSARMKNQASTPFDHETVHKLNQLMTLCSTEEAIQFPVILNKVIWRGRTVFEIVADQQILSSYPFDKERLQQLASRVLEAMPKWLRYGTDDTIRGDVEKLLTNRSVLIGA